MTISTTFQMGSRRPIPQYSPLSFGRRTLISHLICSGMLPCSQMACINLTDVHHLSPSPESSSSSFLRTASRSHTLMCSACSPDAPAARPFQSPRTTDRSSQLLGGPSGMSALSTWMGRGSPGEGTLPYNAMRLAVWAASDIGLAAGADSDAVLYHPFRHCHASFVSPPARCLSIASTTSAAR
jgi:hypothetical protein